MQKSVYAKHSSNFTSKVVPGFCIYWRWQWVGGASWSDSSRGPGQKIQI